MPPQRLQSLRAGWSNARPRWTGPGYGRSRLGSERSASRLIANDASFAERPARGIAGRSTAQAALLAAAERRVEACLRHLRLRERSAQHLLAAGRQGVVRQRLREVRDLV